MRTLRGLSRSLKSLHRIASTSDVPVVTRRHTRVGIRRPPDVLAVITLLADGDAVLTCEPRTLRRLTGESKTGRSPRTPSIVSRTCKPKPAGRAHGNLWSTVHTRTVSPSAHPRPASVELRTSSRLAPSLGHQQTLRSTGGEDARCVQSMSATQTNYVHPHLVAFPARSRSFRCGETPRRLRLRAVIPGDRTFHDVRGPLRRIVTQHESRALLPHGLETRAWALSSHGAGWRSGL